MEQQEPIKEIRSLSGEHTYLSSHYRCPIKVDCITYPSVYHAFVAKKTNVIDIKLQIANILLPQDLIAFEKTLPSPFYWTEEFQLVTMFALTEQKFADPILEEKLIKTGSAIILNRLVYNDRFWGIYNEIGRNHQGVINEEIRRRKQVPITVP